MTRGQLKMLGINEVATLDGIQFLASDIDWDFILKFLHHFRLFVFNQRQVREMPFNLVFIFGSKRQVSHRNVNGEHTHDLTSCATETHGGGLERKIMRKLRLRKCAKQGYFIRTKVAGRSCQFWRKRYVSRSRLDSQVVGIRLHADGVK